jgi:hypothetical protein
MVRNHRIAQQHAVNPVAKIPKPAIADTAFQSTETMSTHSLQRLSASPDSLSTSEILQFQHTLGNRAVGALLGAYAAQRPVIQAKLMVNAPGDKYEQEADRVAEQVVGMPRVRQTFSVEYTNNSSITPLQTFQHIGDGPFEFGDAFERQMRKIRGRGQELPPRLRYEFEGKFGADFSGVRVHADNQADQLNESIQAKAFTTGKDVFFRQGTFNPGSLSGKTLIAHELTHVVQQNGHDEPKSQETNRSMPKNSLEQNVLLPSRMHTPSIQRATVSQSPRYMPGLRKKRPTSVTVRIKDNKVLSKGANSPKKQVEMDMAGWNTMSQAFEWNNQECSDYIVKMHLWNGRLGGPGTDARNLVPGKNTENTEMARNIESKMQRHFTNNDCKEMEIETSVRYDHSSNENSPLYNYPSKINVKWTSFDSNKKPITKLSGNGCQELSSPTEKDGDFQPMEEDEDSDSD